MHTPSPHLDDEHMQFYKWSGAGPGCVVPQRPKRTHPWHASCAVLAVMTTLLLLNGCSNKDPAEQAGTQVDQSVQDMAEPVAPLNENGEPENSTAGDGATQADPAQDEAGEELQKQ